MAQLTPDNADQRDALVDALRSQTAALDAQPPMFNSRWSESTSSPAFGNRGIGAQR